MSVVSYPCNFNSRTNVLLEILKEMYCLLYSRIKMAEIRCSYFVVYFVYGQCNEKPYTWKETRVVVLHLSQVSSCSVLINLRNNVLNFAVFTTVFEFKFGFSGVNKHFLLPWQQFSYDLNNSHFRTSPVDIYLHANLSWGVKIFHFPENCSSWFRIDFQALEFSSSEKLSIH